MRVANGYGYYGQCLMLNLSLLVQNIGSVVLTNKKRGGVKVISVDRSCFKLFSIHAKSSQNPFRSRIHERTISLRLLYIILRVLMRVVSVWIS